MRLQSVIGGLLVQGLAQAAQGTLIVEVEEENGDPCPADVEIRKAGQNAIVKTLAVLGVASQTPLDPGEYDLKAIAKGTSGKTTNKRVTILSNESTRYVLKVAAPSTKTEKTIAGEIKPKKKAGKVVLLRETETVDFKDGKFTLKTTTAGKYQVAVYDSKGKLLKLKPVEIKTNTESITIK